MLHLALAFLAAFASQVMLLGFRDLVTPTALAVLVMPIMPAFVTVGLAGIGLILPRLMSPVWPRKSTIRIFRGIAALSTPNHLTTEDVIANLAMARAATCHSEQENHPKDRHPRHPTPPVACFAQAATERSDARRTKNSSVYRSN